MKLAAKRSPEKGGGRKLDGPVVVVRLFLKVEKGPCEFSKSLRALVWPKVGLNEPKNQSLSFRM